MEKNFQSFIEDNHLVTKNDRILLGVSGGIDSVCMFHLFRLAGYSIGIAHCNFQLRGNESDKDELFVKELANEFNIPIFTNKFNTSEIAEKQGISIQMAARDLRYEWFKDLKEKYEYKFIAIAHNSDDVIETFFINLTRGSGIRGLTGIKIKREETIRPLIFASRKNIEAFMNKNGFAYQEDSTNKKIKYTRNLIRHEVIPLLERKNPAFKSTMLENIERLKETEKIYTTYTQQEIKIVSHKSDQKIYINVEKIKNHEIKSTLLHEILHPFGFSNTQVKDVIKSLDGIPGKQFLSLTHKLIKDRKELIIEEISLKRKKNYFIHEDKQYVEIPLKLDLSKFTKDENFIIEKSKQIGLFDFDKLNFPLTLRKWEKGDYFMPLGMKSLKKLSDFFIDIKLPLTEKEKAWILESGNKIVWIIGYRIDERFKVTDETNQIFRINVLS